MKKEIFLQIYMRSLSINAEECRIRQTEMEDWMKDRQIPDNIQHRISQFFEYKWIATQGVEEDSILIQLPADLRREIKQHLCLDLVRRVSSFLVPVNILCSNKHHSFYLFFMFER